MKLLIVGYLHGDGGVKFIALALARGMAERGHEVTVATPDVFAGRVSNMPSSDLFRIVNVDRLGQILKGYPGDNAAYDCAIIMGTGWKSMIGLLLNRRIRKRVFFEVVGGYRDRFFDPRMLVHLGFNAIVGQGAPVEANFCRNFKWTSHATTIAGMSHPLEEICDLTRPKPRIPAQGQLKACYYSRLVEHKGAHWLVEQWDSISRDVATLDIWGSGEDEGRIRALIAERNLGAQIRLCGLYSGDAAYIAQLQTYDVELLPTFGIEGAPIVLLESMACGVPFVANGVDGIPMYANQDCRITDGKLENFLPALKSLAEALYEDEIDFERLQSHYVEHFSFKALCDQWESFLVNLVAA